MGAGRAGSSVVIAVVVAVVGSDEVGDVDVDSMGDGPEDWGKEPTSNSSAVTFDSSPDAAPATRKTAQRLIQAGLKDYPVSRTADR
jgi:hypothetical protein